MQGPFYDEGPLSFETQILNHYHFVGILGAKILRITSCRNALGTSAASSILAGNASIYPENMSTSTRRYLKLLGTLGMPVKSNFQCSPGYVPLVSMDLIWELLGRLVLELFIVQMRRVSALQLSILILFMPGVTMTSTDQLYKEGFLPIVNSLMSLPDGMTHAVWKKDYRPCLLTSHPWVPRSIMKFCFGALSNSSFV